MHTVIKVTADDCAALASRFCFQIAHLTYQAAFPEQVTIQLRYCFDGFAEFRNHSQTESVVAGDRLMAGSSFGYLSAFPEYKRKSGMASTTFCQSKSARVAVCNGSRALLCLGSAYKPGLNLQHDGQK
jgi:hypothetical protein